MSEKKVELNIYQKLNNFAASVEAIKKDKKGYNYKYADINAVLDVIRPRLSENGLVIIQNLKKEETGYNLNTKLINIDNPDEFLEIDIPLFFKQDMQGLGSAITYARRYGIVTLLSLEQEDDDGVAAKPAQKQTQKNPKLIVWENIVNRFKGDKESAKKFAEIAKLQGYNLEDTQILNNQNFQKLITDYQNGNI